VQVTTLSFNEHYFLLPLLLQPASSCLLIFLSSCLLLLFELNTCCYVVFLRTATFEQVDCVSSSSRNEISEDGQGGYSP